MTSPLTPPPGFIVVTYKDKPTFLQVGCITHFYDNGDGRVRLQLATDEEGSAYACDQSPSEVAALIAAARRAELRAEIAGRLAGHIEAEWARGFAAGEYGEDPAEPDQVATHAIVLADALAGREGRCRVSRYEYTGEVRCPRAGEWFIAEAEGMPVCAPVDFHCAARPILRPLPDTDAPALVVGLAVVGNVVLFRVLEQDESRIPRGEFMLEVQDMTVMSKRRPAIGGGAHGGLLYIRGSERQDDTRVALCERDTPADAQALAEKVRATVRALNAHLARPTPPAATHAAETITMEVVS